MDEKGLERHVPPPSMRRFNLFGRHLYGQIVYPLLAAAVVVGFVATVVAVYFLQDLTAKWVAEMARASTDNVAGRFENYVVQTLRVTRLAANGQRLVDAADAGDEAAISALLASQNSTLDYDVLAVVDSRGRVVASAGAPRMRAGEQLVDADLSVRRPGAYLAQLRGIEVLCALQPIGESSPYMLAAGSVIDEGLLIDLGANSSTAVCFYGGDGEDVALSIGQGFDVAERAEIDIAMRTPDPAVSTAIDAVASGEPVTAALKTPSGSYQLWTRRVSFPTIDSGAQYGYLVGLVSQSVSTQAATTTTRLIVMWSVVAVVMLVGLGGWVARRVSEPLVELAQGARRIADGDFTTKVRVSGSNEIAELAESFNLMTDSLHDRSETLTKKVLELATLYEMSRALGSTLDLEELLDSVLESALRIFDLDLGYITLRDVETGGLEIRAIRGVVSSDADIALRSSMSDWVVREGRPLIFNPESGSTSGQVDDVTGARAALCVPLMTTEGTTGSITIGSSDLTYRFGSDDVRLLSTIANHVTIAIGNIELFTSLQEAYLATVRSLAAAVDAKDTYTRGHSDRVATYATMIADQLGLASEQRIALEMAAYLHDIGKIGVREDILLKPGKLDEVEMAQMRHHPLIGANILRPVAFPWAITPVVRHHHEHYDGTGYPAGLKGEEIPLLARILTVADSYEAMTADRPYRRGRSAGEALEELSRCSGSQFDPRVVTVFSEIVESIDAADQPSARVGMGDEVGPEEGRAIFVALVEGVFSSFRRLGGPKLSSNVETEFDRALEEQGTAFRIVRGRVVFSDDPPDTLDGELLTMRTSLRQMDSIMSRLSGTGLVDHFYAESLEAMSSRMQRLVGELGLYEQR